MITEARVQKIFDYLQANDPKLAEAKAKLHLLDNQIKSVKADIKNQSDAKTDAAREDYALSHPDYKAHLKSVYDAELEYEKLKLTRDTAMAMLDAWRTQESTARSMIKGFA